MKKLGIILFMMIGLLSISNTAALAEEAVTQQALEAVQSTLQVGIDTVWVLFTAFLVFFMNLGFGMLEAGLCRAKNTVNILAKNFIVFAISSVAFWIIGWGFMFGDGNLFVGLKGLFFLSGADNSPAIDSYTGVYSAISWSGVPLWAKFFFQLVFAGTAATIVSGVVAASRRAPPPPWRVAPCPPGWLYLLAVERSPHPGRTCSQRDASSRRSGRLACGARQPALRLGTMMAVTLQQFEANLTKSGLFTPEELSAFRESLPSDRRPEDAQALARELIRAERLTT